MNIALIKQMPKGTPIQKFRAKVKIAWEPRTRYNQFSKKDETSVGMVLEDGSGEEIILEIKNPPVGVDYSNQELLVDSTTYKGHPSAKADHWEKNGEPQYKIKANAKSVTILGADAPQAQPQQQGGNVSYTPVSQPGTEKISDYQNCFVLMQYYHYFRKHGMGDDAAERAAVHISMSLSKKQITRDGANFEWRENHTNQ